MFTTILTILVIWNAGRKETGEGRGEVGMETYVIVVENWIFLINTKESRYGVLLK